MNVTKLNRRKRISIKVKRLLALVGIKFKRHGKTAAGTSPKHDHHYNPKEFRRHR